MLPLTHYCEHLESGTDGDDSLSESLLRRYFVLKQSPPELYILRVIHVNDTNLNIHFNFTWPVGNTDIALKDLDVSIWRSDALIIANPAGTLSSVDKAHYEYSIDLILSGHIAIGDEIRISTGSQLSHNSHSSMRDSSSDSISIWPCYDRTPPHGTCITHSTSRLLVPQTTITSVEMDENETPPVLWIHFDRPVRKMHDTPLTASDFAILSLPSAAEDARVVRVLDAQQHNGTSIRLSVDLADGGLCLHCRTRVRLLSQRFVSLDGGAVAGDFEYVPDVGGRHSRVSFWLQTYRLITSWF